MKTVITTVLLACTIAAHAFADGKMFLSENVPPQIPYQRALILFDQGKETLILQSKYAISVQDGKPTLGWVVPVPAAPEVAGMSAYASRRLFMHLSMVSQPDYTRIRSLVLPVMVFVVMALSLLTLLVCLLSCVIPFPHRFKKNRERLVRYAMRGLFWGFLGGVLLVVLIPNYGYFGAGTDVDVISKHQVGIYDVRVVRSNDPESLMDWLNEHDFAFGERDIATFESYISKGWCFVVALVNPGAREDDHFYFSEGLADPLILRFPHPTPIYPLALTGTGGFETEILLYLAAPTKMTCNGRLALRFAGQINGNSLEVLSANVEPEGFFDPEAMDQFFLSKFKGSLTPEQMSEDLFFQEAEDAEPYREHSVEW